jgi:Amt family ammonium transporter
VYIVYSNWLTFSSILDQDPLMPPLAPAAVAPLPAADSGWMLVATALVLLMLPGLGLFYGGLVRSKNALNTLMMTFGGFAVAVVAWIALGYSLAFAPGSSALGGVEWALLGGVGLEPRGTIPHLLFFAFQTTFAGITVALVAGAVVERMRFSAWLAFAALWTLVVYAPICRWIWGGGWLAGLGALDFAGGAVVHVNAGAAALVAASSLGPRRDWGRQALLPHNVPLVVLGAGLLWFGWFGFNAGSALAVGSAATLAFVNTLLAPVAALVAWMALDALRTRRATAVGAATAIVVGLVAVTPAAGFVSPRGALAIGALATLPSYFALLARGRSRLDDSLDVVAAHGLGGLTGALLTGVFAAAAWGGTAGALEGRPDLVLRQAAAIAATLVWSALGTRGILALLARFAPLAADARTQARGLDVALHGEEAYGTGEGAILVLEPAAGAGTPRVAPAPIPAPAAAEARA